MTRIRGSRKRVLVTGGAGFLGSHLVDRLIERGADVLCVDNLDSGARDNIAHLARNPRFELLRHDICHPLHVEVDEIYNLASPASPIHYQYDPVQTTRTSVNGSINMLGLARRLGCRIFQASTSQVYGDAAVHPQPEHYWGNVNPIGPRSCYEEGKRCAETLFFDYHRQHGVEIKVARFFSAYGPRLRLADGRVIPNLIAQALTGQPITLYGDGRQTRAFCYVDDLIDGILALMASPAAFTGPVNLGNPEEVAIGDLVTMIVELTGSPSRIERRPLPQDDPVRSLPDIGLARKVLGWEPKVTLREGLGRTIGYFRRVLGAAAFAGKGAMTEGESGACVLSQTE
jgi:UDP-glucuronate decarboxylase